MKKNNPAFSASHRPAKQEAAADESDFHKEMRRTDRRAMWAGEISERRIGLLREAKPPDWCAKLDIELKDWKP